MHGVYKIFALGVALGLAGCGTWGGGEAPLQKIDYKKSRGTPSLEIPPDLGLANRDDELMVPDITPAQTATYSQYTSERSEPRAVSTANVLPQAHNVELKREGTLSWLVVQGEAETLWPRIRQFWMDNGFELKIDDSRIGILETGWAENRADIPQDFIRRTIGKAFDFVYSAATRDQFRLRLERGGEPGTTEIYITHRGMREVSQADTFVWEPRPSDPELEAEMLKRLLVHLGIAERRAETVAADFKETPAQEPALAELQQENGQPVLLVREDFARAWRLTGLALDRTGFTVEDRDRAQGMYYIRYIASEIQSKDEAGFFAKLAFWRDKGPANLELRLKLSEAGEHSRIVVLDKDARALEAELAKHILELLRENLK